MMPAYPDTIVDVQHEGDPSDFDEGLGTVYERFMLNRLFERLMGPCSLNRVLEVPIYGTTGLTGINSVFFAGSGCKVTLVDPQKENVEKAAAIWRLLPYDNSYDILWNSDLSHLPFPDASFDLAWNFAALWHVGKPALLLAEMARVTSNLLLIVLPNRIQLGYPLRKYFLDRKFFDSVDERWADTANVRSTLASLGLRLRERGVVDVPPWPDTCLPVGRVLEKLGIRRASLRRGLEKSWRWDIVRYYTGEDRTLKDRVGKFSFIETLPIPWQLKTPLAHHKYLLFSKN